MSMNQIKTELKLTYPGVGWAKRIDKMTDQQAVAIYIRLKKKGVIK